MKHRSAVRGELRWCFGRCQATTWQKRETIEGPWVCSVCGRKHHMVPSHSSRRGAQDVADFT